MIKRIKKKCLKKGKTLIEVEDIKRIVLEPDEVLLFRISSKNTSKSAKAKLGVFLQWINDSNHFLKGRVLAISDDIKLEAVKKK